MTLRTLTDSRKCADKPRTEASQCHIDGCFPEIELAMDTGEFYVRFVSPKICDLGGCVPSFGRAMAEQFLAVLIRLIQFMSIQFLEVGQAFALWGLSPLRPPGRQISAGSYRCRVTRLLAFIQRFR